MKNNQKQMEYLQSEPTSKKPGVSKEHKCEVLMLYNSSQKRTRRRGPGLPKANNCMRCQCPLNSLNSVLWKFLHNLLFKYFEHLTVNESVIFFFEISSTNIYSTYKNI